MKDCDGNEKPHRIVLKWVREQRRVSYQWCRRQYKGVEDGKYTMEEWTKFLVDSKTVSKEMPHVSEITPEWTLLEREWLVETIIKKLTSHRGEVVPLSEIEYGIDLYFMVDNFAKDLFARKTIKKLHKILTNNIYYIQRVEDQYKMMSYCNGLFKAPVEQMKKNGGPKTTYYGKNSKHKLPNKKKL